MSSQQKEEEKKDPRLKPMFSCCNKDCVNYVKDFVLYECVACHTVTYDKIQQWKRKEEQWLSDMRGAALNLSYAVGKVKELEERLRVNKLHRDYVINCADNRYTS